MRVALDRSARAPGRPLTGIGRYVEELSRALAGLPAIELLQGPAFDLWAGLSGGGGWRRVLQGAVNEHLRLPAALERAGADLYHATASRAPGPRTGRALVVTVHDFAAFDWPGLQGRRRGAQLRRQVSRAIARATLVVVPSAAVAGAMAERFPRHAHKARVVHHGVAQPLAAARSSPASAPVFVSVATLERRKNLATLVEAFARVRAREPRARLRLLGQDQNDSTAVRTRLAALGLADAVACEGYVSDAALAEAYASATATIYPSLYEGFGLPVLESLAAGAPVVASDIPVLREVAGEAALFVDPADPEMMAQAMLRLATDAELRARLVAAGRARAAALTWRAAAEGHGAVYREAVALFAEGRA